MGSTDTIFMPWRWVCDREIGSRKILLRKVKNRQSDQLYHNLYSSTIAVDSWEPSKTTKYGNQGGVFNFDFSKDGSILAAVCEKKSILIFDPLSRALIDVKEKAHNDCVNCVRFLDSRTFATCSDDTTVALWDIRYLKNKIRVLRGHTNWVKNIEYASDHGVLLSSGFDGNIFTWDINNYSETIEHQRVFYTNGLMRSKLTPDCSKLVISTAGGYLMVIHNLDLTTLGSDMHGFKPNMYRLMQMSRSPIRQGYMHNEVFERTRNCVELISDFPEGDEAEMISSLQIHPQGWSVLSRNSSADENTEWTCVHDIQKRNSTQNEGLESIDESHDHSDKELSNDEALSQNSNRRTMTITLPGSTPSSTNPSRSNSPAFMLSISIDETGSRTPSTTSHSPTGFRHPSEEISPSSRSASVNVTPENLNLGGQRSSPDSRSNRSSASSLRLNMVGGSPEISSRPVAEGSVTHAIPAGSQVARGVRITVSTGSGSADNHSGYTGGSNSGEHGEGDPFRGMHRSVSTGTAVSQNGLNTDHSHNQTEPNEENQQDDLSSDPDFVSLDSVQVRDTGFDNTDVTGNSSVIREVYHDPQDPNDSAANQAAVPGPSRQSDSVTFVIRSGSQHMDRTLLLLSGNKQSCSSNPDAALHIHDNVPRLTHFIEEPAVGRGFIKELCFSSDGRLVISPFGFGVRLLAFNPVCSELCDCVPQSPVQFYELTTNMSHSNMVVSTKFSPTHSLFVSGCLNGKVSFHQPRL